MKVRDDQMCSYCNDVVDYIEHCPTVQKIWNYIEQYILITFDIQTHILFGIKQHNCGKFKTKRINHINSENVYKYLQKD